MFPRSNRPQGRRLPAAVGVALAATLTVSAGTVVASQVAPSGAQPTSVGALRPSSTPAVAEPAQRLVLRPALLPATVPSGLLPVPAGELSRQVLNPAASSIPRGASAPLAPVTHPQDDHLGSTVCAHEQCQPLHDIAAAQAAPSGQAPEYGSLGAAPSTAPQQDTAGAAPAAANPRPASPEPASPVPTATLSPPVTAPTNPPAPRPVASPNSPVASPTTPPPAPTSRPVASPPTTPPTAPAPRPVVTTAPVRRPVVTTAPAPPKAAVPDPTPDAGPHPRGMDVSSYQQNVDWPAAFARGARFVYAKATEGTSYRNPYFAQQYNGSRSAGLIRGAYHFALPDRSSGAAQAGYFTANGGGWSPDGSTLPPMLDIEYNPYGQTCYGMSRTQMTNWISDFSDTVRARTSRYPTIYTTRDWWDTCTASPGFGATNPLFVACYCNSPGTMPTGWGYETIWQYNYQGDLPGDQDLFNGSYTNLRRLAAGV